MLQHTLGPALWRGRHVVSAMLAEDIEATARNGTGGKPDRFDPENHQGGHGVGQAMFLNKTRFNSSDRFFKQQRASVNRVHLKKSAFIFTKGKRGGGFVNNCIIGFYIIVFDFFVFAGGKLLFDKKKAD